MFLGLVILGYTQYAYMSASLGCGPRDTLLVGISKRIKSIPIGAVSIIILSTATFIGWLLGGPVGIGTIINRQAEDLKIVTQGSCLNNGHPRRTT